MSQDAEVVAGDYIGHVLQVRRSPARSSAVRHDRRMVRRVRVFGCPRTSVRPGPPRRHRARRWRPPAPARKKCDCCEVELAQVVDRHARAAGHHYVGDHQPGIGQGRPGDDRPEAVGDHGQRLLRLQGQGGDELREVVGGRRQVVGALDRPRRRGQDVGRVVVALPQHDSRRGARLVEVDGVGDPVRRTGSIPSPTPGTSTATCSAASRSPKRSV